ncbi:hypothetical protein EDB84DRAFT_164252 [Lactarius hengduanensis]|nr:hypothetical protein EDB84DRAFT_164252 [Lactarius hengduanensis]
MAFTIQRDEELDALVRATIADGGVLPFIHKSLTSGKIKKPEGASPGLLSIRLGRLEDTLSLLCIHVFIAHRLIAFGPLCGINSSSDARCAKVWQSAAALTSTPLQQQ